ncbi:MAG TPA: YciI family protein [Caulobacteraceae bacterium]
MLYAILCYNDENAVFSWSKAEDDAVMARLAVVQQKLASTGKLGPAVRLMPTTAATTLRKDREPALVVDGPFAETKEQLLGFYIVDFENLEEALEWTRELGQANPGGAYELRPLRLFLPGADVSDRELAVEAAG